MSKIFSGEQAAIVVHSSCYCKLIVNFGKGLWTKYQYILSCFIVTFSIKRMSSITQMIFIIPVMFLAAALNNLRNRISLYTSKTTLFTINFTNKMFMRKATGGTQGYETMQSFKIVLIDFTELDDMLIDQLPSFGSLQHRGNLTYSLRNLMAKSCKSRNNNVFNLNLIIIKSYDYYIL